MFIGGLDMDYTTNGITFEMICDTIAEFAPCMDDYLYVYDIKQDRYYISEQALARFFMKTNSFTNVLSEHRRFVYRDDVEMLVNDLQELTEGKKDEHDIRYRWIGKEGDPIWINCRGRVIKNEENEPIYLIGCVNEIGVAQIADNVSGLLTIGAFEDALQEVYENHNEGYVLRLGLDDFKEINEKFGTDYGDYILHAVAECIISCLMPGQKAYRVIADEYLVMDFTYGTKADADDLYTRIKMMLDRFIETNKYEAVYTVSAGVVYCEELEFPEYEELMKYSHFTLSMAKKRGKNQIYHFDSRDYDLFLRKKNILRELRQSVSVGFKGFDLHFQPVVMAEGQDVYGSEALLRFTMPDGEAISPVEFIPILEESGLIIPVGKWVLDRAIEMCKYCQKTIPNFRVSVNLSYVQVLKSSITTVISQKIQDFGIEPESLIVEMTESGYLENTPSVRNVWDRLKDVGIYIALDDFGTGYSNLQSIGNMTPNVVKLDRGFTTKALKNEYENQVMAHVIQMVHGLGLKTCVEGIETEEEFEKISELNPDYIQGYYFGKPCNKDEFIAKYIAR